MTPPPKSLQDTFTAIPLSSHGTHWDNLYRDDFTPWDRGNPSIALHDVLHARPDLIHPAQEHDHRGKLIRDETGAVEKRKALVPGCGRGHDVLLLSAWGYDVWGLDYSPAARDLAIQNQEKAAKEGLYKPVEGLEKGKVEWVTGDFFSDEWAKDAGIDGKFDLIFDYTVRPSLSAKILPISGLQ